MGILKDFIIQIKILFKKEDSVTYIAPCGTVVAEIPSIVEVPEGKEMTKFNPQTGKLYWPSDNSYAEHIGIRDIPKKYERKRRNKTRTSKRNK